MKSEAEQFFWVKPRVVHTVTEFAKDYDALLVDSYGVLNDGSHVYGGALDCLAKLRAQGKVIIVLTNTPRPAAVVKEELGRVGITVSAYDDLVSAGEVAMNALSGHAFQSRGIGRRCYYIGPERSRPLLGDLGLEEVARIDQCDLALITGLKSPSHVVDDYEEVLVQLANRELPTICVNPDRYAIRGGQFGPASGAVGRRLEELGGKVVYIGKPYPDIYQTAFNRAEELGAHRVACVGDGLETDILGASSFGIDSLFIAGGVHHVELGQCDVVDEEKLRVLCSRFGVVPSAVIKSFQCQ